MATDDSMANLAFAEGSDDEAVRVARELIGAAWTTYETLFTMLMEVAALADGGHLGDARATLYRFRALAPEPLQHLSFMRQNFNALPDPAWQRFRDGLVAAGLDP